MEMSFTDYLAAVNEAIFDLFLVPPSLVARVDTAIVKGARADGWTPEQFAVWHGKNDGMITIEDVEHMRRCQCYACTRMRECQ